jgi:hypothetical protein
MKSGKIDDNLTGQVFTLFWPVKKKLNNYELNNLPSKNKKNPKRLKNFQRSSDLTAS